MSRFEIQPTVEFLHTFNFYPLRQPHSEAACQEFFDAIIPFLDKLPVRGLQGPEFDDLQQVLTLLISKFNEVEEVFFGKRYDEQVELQEMNRDEYIMANAITEQNFLSRSKIIFCGSDESNSVGLTCFLRFASSIKKLISLLSPQVNQQQPQRLFFGAEDIQMMTLSETAEQPNQYI